MASSSVLSLPRVGAWQPSRPIARRPLAGLACSASITSCSASEQELLRAVEGLGYPAAIFPGDEQARAGIDASITALEAASPTPSPLRQPERGGQPAPQLLGEWKLIYASSGTYVTRTAAAQALLAASRLPGVGLSDVRQSLQLPQAAAPPAAGGASSGGELRTSNAACFGLGPFGDWEVVLNGVWTVRDGSLAQVTFDGFTLQLVGLLGLLKLPRMAKVSVPVKNSAAADFSTTYLSSELRIARGRTGNVFLFSRLPSS